MSKMTLRNVSSRFCDDFVAVMQVISIDLQFQTALPSSQVYIMQREKLARKSAADVESFKLVIQFSFAPIVCSRSSMARRLIQHLHLFPRQCLAECSGSLVTIRSVYDEVNQALCFLSLHLDPFYHEALQRAEIPLSYKHRQLLSFSATFLELTNPMHWARNQKYNSHKCGIVSGETCGYPKHPLGPSFLY